jgi:glucose/arabinose dehydrogenase
MLAFAAAAATLAAGAAPAPSPGPPVCTAGNAGLTLPPGFCATLYAESLTAPRHMVVAPNGDLVVSLRSTRSQAGMVPGGVVILRDSDGDGRADQRHKFGEYSSSAVALVGEMLYVDAGSAILRYRLPAGGMAPAGAPDTAVRDMPTGGHAAKTFVVRDADLLVNHGSRTNACQERDRATESPGVNPCPELEARAGIWRYSAAKTGQTPADGERYATGIRNAIAMAVEPRSGDLYVVQHGRDQLSGNWPRLFTDARNAETPAEELFHVRRGDDFGWPYCYFDPELRLKVLAPEYGGDGKTVGLCAGKKGNVAHFPGHWAPNGLLFYTGSALPARYRNGAFVVFHGAWNRAPLPLQGFKVVFQPMSEGRAAGPFEVFVDGFYSVAENRPTELGGRPTGLTQGRSGELYLSDDGRGRIWRIWYAGAATP